MILPASPSKPFSYNMKGLPKRRTIVPEYQAEIDALYDAVDETTQADLRPPQTWTYINAKQFVSAVIERVLDRPLGEHDDLFQNSCDRYARHFTRTCVMSH